MHIIWITLILNKACVPFIQQEKIGGENGGKRWHNNVPLLLLIQKNLEHAHVHVVCVCVHIPFPFPPLIKACEHFHPQLTDDSWI